MAAARLGNEVNYMLLMYMLFALTVSTVLTAVVSSRITKDREGEAFIGFFALLLALAWAADQWLLPVLSTGHRTIWLPILLLTMFAGVLAASTGLSVRTRGKPLHATVHHGNRLDTEAMVFDLILWFALLFAGISVLASLASIGF